MTAERFAVRIEHYIGRGISEARTQRGITQAELGERLERYTGKAWSRQAVSSAELGNRAFTAADLLALSLALETPVTLLMAPMTVAPGNNSLDLPTGEQLPGETVLEVCFGPAESRSDGEVLSRLVDTWSSAQDLATRLQFIIRGLILDEDDEEGAMELFGDHYEPKGDAPTDGEGADS